MPTICMVTQSKGRRRIVRMAMTFAALVVLIYVALTLLVFFGQRRMLYHPTTYPLEASLKVAANYGLEPWRNASGQLIGWKHLAGTNAPHDRALILHGNAGSAIDRVDYAAGLNDASPCDVYILEFPGYGPRP